MRGTFGLGLAALLLTGCADQSFTLRTLPAQTPAADLQAQIKAGAAMMAASTAGKHGQPQRSDVANASDAGPSIRPLGAQAGTATPPRSLAASTAPPLTPAEAPSMYSYDPWEKLNRFTYRFNARFDDGVFLPVANGYRRVLPNTVRVGIHDFFSNLAEIPSIANYVLQLRWINGARNIARFVINSTIGIGGLLDIATQLDLPAAQTGLGATLATYGVHPGPYLVIPLLGPATLRDGVGLMGDYAVNYYIDPVDLYRGAQSYVLSTVNAVDQRSNISFRYFGTGSPFEYETVRFLYVHKELIEDDALRRWWRPRPRETSVPAGK